MTVQVEARENMGCESPGTSSSQATIQVADEGPGIAPEDLPHLFEMFFRKKDPGDIRTGRGLGLHFCRLVVAAHRGIDSGGESFFRRRRLFRRTAAESGGLCRPHC